MVAVSCSVSPGSRLAFSGVSVRLVTSVGVTGLGLGFGLGVGLGLGVGVIVSGPQDVRSDRAISDRATAKFFSFIGVINACMG